MGHRLRVHSRFRTTADTSRNCLTILFGRVRRLTGGIALCVLLAGLLSASTDALLDHPGHGVPIQASKCLRHSFTPHVVREHATQKLPPCNACLLRSLLAHTLIAVTTQSTSASPSSRFHQTYRSFSSVMICPEEENRSPPTNQYL